MKKNTWVFYFFIVLFTALLSVHLVWKFTPVKDEISASLQKRLRPYLGESFTMHEFSLGFGYISFYDIQAGSEKEGYLLYLDEIQIGYSMHKLLVHNLDPLQVIESITFKNPRLTVLTGEKDLTTDTSDVLDATKIVTGFRKLSEIDRIFIQDGEIRWGFSPTQNNRIMDALNGLLIIRPDNRAKLNLKGKLFDSPAADLTLTGEMNLAHRTWDLQTKIENCRLRDGLPFLKGEHFSINEAEIDGQLRLRNSSFNIRNVSVEGSLLVKNMKARLFNQNMKTDNFYLRYNGQKMILPSVTGQVEDGMFSLTGNLGYIFKPELNFSVDFHDYSVKNIAASAPIMELLNKGRVRGNLEIRGPASEVVIDGTLFSPQLYYNIAPFYRTSMDFTFSDKLWEFRKIRTHTIGMAHFGSGEIDFNANTMSLKIFSQKHLDSGIFPILDRLNNTDMKYFTTVNGDFPSRTFTGSLFGLFSDAQDTLLTLGASYKLVEDHLAIRGGSIQPGGMEIKAEVSDLWNVPTFNILELTDVPFTPLSTHREVHWLTGKYRSDFYFSGPVNYPSAKVKFINRNTQESFFSLSGSAINLIRPGLKFKGRFTFQTIPRQITGNISLQKKNNNVLLSLDAPEIAEGRLSIASHNGPFNGQLKFQKINVKQFLGDLPKLQTAISQGNITGVIDFSGTTGNPQINFDLQASNFIINQNGYYSARLKGGYTTSALNFDQAWINYNNRPIFTSRFNWNIEQNQVNAHFEGREIESNFLAATLFKNPDLVAGNLNYEISMEGEFRRPRISGNILLQRGMLEKRPFKNLNIIFEDSIPPQASLFTIDEHVFKIYKLIYVDGKDYTIEAAGSLPVNANEPLNLKINVRGNILAELPDAVEFCRNPSSNGEMFLQISGNRESPQLQTGYVNIYNGSLEFESVIPKLTNLKAQIELARGENFVRIRKLEGEIGGRWVSIHNRRSLTLADTHLQPWDFKEFELNLGVLLLKTDPAGIPLSIPGLMNPEDIGYFAMNGQTPDEAFYFAGPPERPHAKGKITLNESRVTFPFLETEGGNDNQNKVIEFLMNMEWDILAVPGVGNRYFVDIPAVIDQVHLDLNIDNVSKGLKFTGRLADESFRVEGNIESTRGRVEYLDMDFRVERFGAIFNRYELYPEVYGRAYTTVRDSTNFPKDIYLELYAIDPETQQQVSRGRWEDFRFKLVSSDPTIGETQENVLAYLGYSLDNITSKAGDVGLTLTENYLIRPLVRPLERKLERGLGLDYVRLRSSIASNLVYFSFHNRLKFLEGQNYYQQNVNNSFDPALLLLQSSEITLGKYLLKDIYVSYSGQLVSVYDEAKLGLNHRLGLEYRLLRNLLLELEYDKFQFNPRFYGQEVLNDFKIRLRHSFTF